MRVGRAGELSFRNYQDFKIDTHLPDSVNTVDVLFSAFPALLYVDSAMAGYALRPLLEFQELGKWPFNYAMQDLGT